MGRRKIAIEPLTDDRNRTVTFTKRKAGLFKKAHELAILCEIDISVIIIGRNHKVYEYSSNDPNEIIDRFKAYRDNIQESKRPQNYGSYETKSRILDIAKLKNNSYTQRLSKEINQKEQEQRSKSSGAKIRNKHKSSHDSKECSQIDSDFDSTEDGEDNITVKNHDFETDHYFEDDQYCDNQSLNKESTTPVNSDGLPNTRKRVHDSRQASLSKNSKRSKIVEITPTTPENNYQSQAALSDTNSVVYKTPSLLKNSKGKDNKRPTLSLKIPSMDNDVDKSNGSTITVTNSSSNKSNSLNTSNSNKDIKGRKEIRIDDRKDVIIPSPVYNVTDSSSDHSANIKMPSMDNSTPLPSALFRDKRIYTPLSTTFMNTLNMIPSAGASSANADLAQLGYFNFNGMSPTQVLTPVFPFTQSHSTIKPGLSKQNSSENQLSHRNSVDGIRRGKLRQLQTQSYKSGPNSLSLQTPQSHLQSPKLHIPPQSSSQSISEMQSKAHSQLQQQSQSQSHPQSQSQPVLPPMNSATSVYFPQNRGNTLRPLPLSTNNSLNGSELPTLSTISGNTNTKFQSHASESVEISGLPSRYVEFQSPTTLFNNHDWSLPTGTTPVLAQSNTSHTFQPRKNADSTPDDTILDKTQES